MQVKLFTLPTYGETQVEEELNKFLRSHRVLQLERHFCAEQGGYWAVLVEYSGGDPVAEAPPATRRDRKDPSEGMDDAEKERYNHMRDVRKMLAQQLALPPYLVFTNEELAILARLPEVTETTVKGLKGIAPQRMKDYIAYFYHTDNDNDETSGQPDAANSLDGEPA